MNIPDAILLLLDKHTYHQLQFVAEAAECQVLNMKTVSGFIPSLSMSHIGCVSVTSRRDCTGDLMHCFHDGTPTLLG